MRGYTDDGGYYVLFTEDEVADMVPDDFDKEQIPRICDELTRYWQDNMQEHIYDIISMLY